MIMNTQKEFRACTIGLSFSSEKTFITFVTWSVNIVSCILRTVDLYPKLYVGWKIPVNILGLRSGQWGCPSRSVSCTINILHGRTDLFCWGAINTPYACLDLTARSQTCIYGGSHDIWFIYPLGFQESNYYTTQYVDDGGLWDSLHYSSRCQFKSQRECNCPIYCSRILLGFP